MFQIFLAYESASISGPALSLQHQLRTEVGVVVVLTEDAVCCIEVLQVSLRKVVLEAKERRLLSLLRKGDGTFCYENSIMFHAER